MANSVPSARSLFFRALTDSSYYLTSDLGSKVISVAVLPIIVRTVSIKEFGTYDMFLMVSNILVMISTLGMDSGGGYYHSRKYK